MVRIHHRPCGSVLTCSDDTTSIFTTRAYYRLQDRRAPAGRDHAGVQVAVDDILDDHSWCQRSVQTGHRHEDQDGRTDTAELRNRTGRTSVCGDALPNGTGGDARRDLSPAP